MPPNMNQKVNITDVDILYVLPFGKIAPMKRLSACAGSSLSCGGSERGDSQELPARISRQPDMHRKYPRINLFLLTKK